MDNKFCIECGFELPITAKFCERCGFTFVLNESTSESESKIESQEIKPNLSKSESELNLLDIIKKYFNGNFSLVKSFWMIALPINFITGIVTRIFPFALIVTIPILIFIFIGLWRSADNYIKNKKKKENKFWGYFVKGQIVLAVILISLSVVVGFILGLSEESEEPVLLSQTSTSSPKTSQAYVPSPKTQTATQSPKTTEADTSSPKTQTDVEKGNNYYNGTGVTQSYSEAAKWYKTAADQGDANAQYRLGNMYMSMGKGVTQNYFEAARLYKLAADQGDANAQFRLGNMYMSMGLGLRMSYIEAFKFIKLAADQGLVDAQSFVGYMYYNGQGTPKNYFEAARWYKLAADQGDDNAHMHLGNMYEKGHGVTQSYSEAVRLYKLAADQGNAGAQSSLGMMYEYGRGVTQSYSEARKWHTLAANQGDFGSEQALERIKNK